MSDPSRLVAQEFKSVATLAQEFAAALGGANGLPDDFPKEQVKEICKSLVLLPFGTTQGGRDQLGYAQQRLPDVRRKYFNHDHAAGDGELVRGGGLDKRFVDLITEVMTAISTIDEEAGKRPPNDKPAARYEIDPNDAPIAEAMRSGQKAAENLDRVGQSLKKITKPDSENADRLRRHVNDGSGLFRMAGADLGFREIVPQWTRKLAKAIEKIPAGLRRAARSIRVGRDIVKPFWKQWKDIEEEIENIIDKNIINFADNLDGMALHIERSQNSQKAQKDYLSRADKEQNPPPDFDIERVKEMVSKGERVPEAWRPWVFELNLRGTRITDATPLKDLTNLTELYLKGTTITNFRPLKELNNLKEIFIESVARAKRIRNQLGRTWHVSKHELIGPKLSRRQPDDEA